MDLMRKNVVSYIILQRARAVLTLQLTGPDAYMNHSCLPEHGWFSCLSKGSKKCMPISRACDGYVDCDDGADEGGQCSKLNKLITLSYN